MTERDDTYGTPESRAEAAAMIEYARARGLMMFIHPAMAKDLAAIGWWEPDVMIEIKPLT